MGININKGQKKKGKTSVGFDWNKLLQTEIKIRSGFGDKIKEQFYNELFTLLTAGVNVKYSLEMMIESQAGKGPSVIITKIKDDLVIGHSLSVAMKASGKFSPYECFSVQIGEESGRLGEVLNELHTYFVKRIKLKRQLVSVLTYPSFVLVIAIGVVYFMMSQIVPMFSTVFNRFDGELPQLTQWIIAASEWFSSYFWLLVITVIGIGIFFFTQKSKTWFRQYSAIIQLRTPVLGKAMKRIYVARFAQSMQLLIGAQTPLIKAVSLVRSMIGFYPLEEALDQIELEIAKGVALHKAMAAHVIFDKKMLALIKAAEEVNQLDKMFSKLSLQYSEEVEHQTNVLGSVLEPLIILFIALFVGVILVGMYLPLFALSTSIG